MLSWFHQLDRASSVADVLRVAREYLATWDPEELGHLPRDCRPGRLKTSEDLEALHACLVDEYRRTRLEGEALSALQRMTSFVVRASVRLVHFAGETPNRADEQVPPGESAAPLQREQ